MSSRSHRLFNYWLISISWAPQMDAIFMDDAVMDVTLNWLLCSITRLLWTGNSAVFLITNSYFFQLKTIRGFNASNNSNGMALRCAKIARKNDEPLAGYILRLFHSVVIEFKWIIKLMSFRYFHQILLIINIVWNASKWIGSLSKCNETHSHILWPSADTHIRWPLMQCKTKLNSS